MTTSDPNKFWDLQAIMEEAGANTVYTDFEGLTDPARVWDIVNSGLVIKYLSTHAKPDFMQDMLVHYVYECIDQAEEPTVDDVLVFASTIDYLLTCRFWMKTGIEEETTDGD